ncbi:outer membrane beta-barrel protein [Helicobacter sp. 23-1044]
MKNADINADVSTMQHTFDWGIIAGYKHFFGENFGVRVYGNLDFNHIGNGNIGGNFIGGTSVDINVMLMGVRANADVLWNFYKGSSIEVGAFAGLGAGAKSIIVSSNLGGGLASTLFDIGANFGLRGNFSHNHGVELGVHVPFRPIMSVMNVEMRQAFSMQMRYIYTFGDAPKAKRTIKRKVVKKNAQNDYE